MQRLWQSEGLQLWGVWLGTATLGEQKHVNNRFTLGSSNTKIIQEIDKLSYHILSDE